MGIAAMQPSPYETPPSQFVQPSEMPPPLADAGPPPASIKVFGILHLILAGWGVIGGGWTVLMLVFFSDFLGWMNRLSGNKQPDSLQQAQLAYMNEIAWINWLQLVFSAVLIVLLLMAGVNLVKTRDKGRVLSVRYAWTSIGMKLVGLVLMVVFALPAATRMNQVILGNTPPQFGNMMGAVTTVSSLVGMASTLIYPILVLFIINGRKVRAYLAGR